jgi:hypothetical protein
LKAARFGGWRGLALPSFATAARRLIKRDVIARHHVEVPRKGRSFDPRNERGLSSRVVSSLSVD